MKKMRKFMSLLLSLAMCGSICMTAVGCDDEDDQPPVNTDQGNTGNEGNGGGNGDGNQGGSGNVAVEVGDVYLPDAIREFELNSAAGKADPKNEFKVTEKSYKVGDDNPFIFKPVVTYEDALGLPTDAPENADFNYLLDEVTTTGNSTSHTPASADMLEYVNTKTCEFDFAEAAKGKTFRLTVSPKPIGEEAVSSVDFTFEVVDGYNAYHDYELAYLSNYDVVKNLQQSDVGNGESRNDQFAWKAYRESHGLTLNPNDIKAVIMHNDIELTKDSFPEIFFYTELETSNKYAVGTLKDQTSSSLYFRMMQENNSFSFIGNYFQLNAEKMPVVVIEDGGKKTTKFDDNGVATDSEVTSHATLLRIHGETQTDGKNNTSATVSDVYLKGNSPFAEGAQGYLSRGGLIFTKTEMTNCTIDNVISLQYFITGFANWQYASAIFKNMKCYNSFNSPIYNWCSTDLQLIDCDFENYGGPAIICDAKVEDGTAIHPRVIATGCTFTNELTGQEPWFEFAQATEYVPTIQQLQMVYSGLNNDGLNSQVSLLNEKLSAMGITVKERALINQKEIDGKQVPVMKLICVVKDDNGDVTEKEGMKAYISINGNVMDYGVGATYFNETTSDEKTKHNTALAKTIEEWGTKASIIETSGLGLGYAITNPPTFTMSRLVGLENTALESASAMEAAKMLSGDMLNLYYNTGDFAGMLGIMFELY